MSIQSINTVREGAVVTLAYTLRLRGGAAAVLPDAPSPLTFVVGDGQILRGVEEAILGLSEGEERDLTLPVEEAFGRVQSGQVITLQRSRFPQDRTFNIGQRLQLRHKDGRVRRGYVTAVTDETVQIDLNHPLAGKVLTFHLNVLKIGAV